MSHEKSLCLPLLLLNGVSHKGVVYCYLFVVKDQNVFFFYFLEIVLGWPTGLPVSADSANQSPTQMTRSTTWHMWQTDMRRSSQKLT